MWLLENLAFLTPLNAYYFQTALCKPTHIKLIDCTLEKKELDNCLFYVSLKSSAYKFIAYKNVYVILARSQNQLY